MRISSKAVAAVENFFKEVVLYFMNGCGKVENPKKQGFPLYHSPTADIFCIFYYLIVGIFLS